MIANTIKPALMARLKSIILAKDEWSLLSDDDDPDGQTLLFAYPRRDEVESPRYVTAVVKLEFGARSDPWPVETRTVVSIVAEEYPALFDAPSCAVRSLLPERTFWEKVMLLHEETFRPPHKPRRVRMARHYYDVWRLIKAGVAKRAVDDIALFERVAAHRKVYFRHSWVDYATLRRGMIRMLPPPEQLEEWRRDYAAMRGEMFFDDPPSFDEILAEVERFQAEFNGS